MKELTRQALEISRRQDKFALRRVEGKRFFFFPRLRSLGLYHAFSSIDSNLLLKDRLDSPELAADWAGLLSLMPSHSVVYYPSQEHTNLVLPVDEEGLGEQNEGALGRKLPGIDGLCSSRKDFVLCSCFGDCAPILLFDPVNEVQANVHSGWRGTLHRIAEEGVESLRKTYRSDPQDIFAAVGPFIGRDDFEVSEDVAKAFAKAFPELEEAELVRPFPGKEAEGKFLVDLGLVIVATLLQNGVPAGQILFCGRSTVSNPGDFHSFRRDKEAFGLMMVASQMDPQLNR